MGSCGRSLWWLRGADSAHAARRSSLLDLGIQVAMEQPVTADEPAGTDTHLFISH